MERHTVADLVRLPALLVNEDDCDEDDDLRHDAQEGPEGGQPTAHAQLNAVLLCAELADPATNVCGGVELDVQIRDNQGGLVGRALYLVFFSVVGDYFLR